MARVRRWLTTAVAVGALTGCALAATARSYDLAPDGLEKREDAFRRLLARGDRDTNALLHADNLPDDKLLRSLYQGILAYYAGSYSRTSAWLQDAEDLADDRYTKSVSQGALALVTNDRALDYVPGDNERLLVHYYNALAYLRAGKVEDAAVEVRRLSHMLEQHDDSRDARDVETRAMLRYFAGSVFEAAGERDNALVAYRNAALLLGDTVRARSVGSPHTGNVVVVVEQGFVTHRVTRNIFVSLGGGDADLFVTDDAPSHRRGSRSVARRLQAQLDESGDDGLYLADASATSLRFTLPPDSLSAQGAARDSSGTPFVAEPLATPKLVKPVVRNGTTWPVSPADATRLPPSVTIPPTAAKPKDGQDSWIVEKILVPVSNAQKDSRHERHASGDGYLLKVSLPTFHRPRQQARPVMRLADSVVTPVVSASLSDAAAGDYRRQRSAILTRAVARALAKYALTKAAEKKAEDKWGDAAGSVGKFAVNMAGAALERADTRSWHLLPERVSITRLYMPSGTHEAFIDVNGQRISLGTVTVPDTGMVFVTKRIWR